jgi:hypothetical protein
MEPNIYLQRELNFCQYLLPANTIQCLYNIYISNSIESNIYLNTLKTEETVYTKMVDEVSKKAINIQDP